MQLSCSHCQCQSSPIPKPLETCPFVVVGIDIDEFRYSRNAFGIFNSFAEYTFQVWDFGGQEEFYTTHQCFLSTLALYLLVWNLEEGIVVMEIFLSVTVINTEKL